MTAPVQLLHDSPLMGAFAVAGGGTGFLHELLMCPGASRTVLHATVPYAFSALTDYLGGKPDRACAPATARAMAMAALQRARQLAPPELAREHLFGVGLSATLATDRPHKGEHRAYLAVQTPDATREWHLVLAKGARDRAGEEQLVSALALHALLSCAGIETAGPALVAGDSLHREEHLGEADWQRLLAGEVPGVSHGPERSTTGRRLVFPGSFNPLHAAHREMARLAEQHTGTLVEFEICALNVDKPPLDYRDLRRRLEQFPPDHRVWITAAATFVAKAALFPNSTFVVGADTVLRIGDRRYYGNDQLARDRAMQDLAEAGARFLVFPRVVEDSYCGLADLALPPVLLDLCEELPYRRDLSSSALRAADAPA